MSDENRISIRVEIDRKIHAKIKALAAIKIKSLPETVEEAINDYVEKNTIK